MKTYHLQLQPQDVLFLRDARPMAAADAGAGANWPRPDQLWNALIHLFHRTWPERQDWEGAAHSKTLAERENGRLSSDRFGALQTVGPFPMFDGIPYFPCPLDLAANDDGELLPMTLTPVGKTDLSPLLKLAFTTPVLGKQSPPAWISQADYALYLSGKTFRPEKKELFSVERNIGIAISPETGATIDGKFYQAEYLRLCKGVSIACLASCAIKPKGRNDGLVDVLDKISLPSSLIIGGQQGLATIDNAAKWHLPKISKPEPTAQPFRLRWTLLSPALFPRLEVNPEKNTPGHPGGWLPSWIDPQTGNVMLPKPTEDSHRRPGESREAWRERRRNQGNIEAKLVAARIGKPLFFSGWDLHQKTDHTEQISQGAKATQAAVPAGSTYVFECQNPDAFKELWQALDAQGLDGRIVRRSANFGEKGFGIGVCSVFPTPKN
jgi:CRISPR type III-B/RAMP module-associated protein Cmr3